MQLSKEDLQEIVASTMKAVLTEGRLVSDEQHTADHEWTLAQRKKAEQREKYFKHVQMVAIGAITISGIGAIASLMAWIGHMVYEAYKAGIH